MGCRATNGRMMMNGRKETGTGRMQRGLALGGMAISMRITQSEFSFKLALASIKNTELAEAQIVRHPT